MDRRDAPEVLVIPSLVLGIDPGTRRAGVALLRPREGDRPELLRLELLTDGPLTYAPAFKRLRKAAGDELVIGWVEVTAPHASGSRAHASLLLTTGRLLQCADEAGLGGGIEAVAANTWPGWLGIRAYKQGRGLHRIGEAQRLVEMPLDALRGMGDASVDAAEAVLIAAARAQALTGERIARLPAARIRRPRTAA